jgi:hypothetical protein
MRGTAIVGAVMMGVTACGGTTAPIEKAPPTHAPFAPTPPPPPTPTPTTPPTPIASASTSAAPEELFSTHGDLDGKGDAPISLTSDGVLRVGAMAIVLELARNEFFWPKQASLVVIEIDKKKGVRGLLFTEPTGESEDPPNRYRLVMAYGGALHVAYDQVLGVYGVTPLEVHGDGTVRYREDGWTACNRVIPKPIAVAMNVTLALVEKKKEKVLVEIARTPSRKVQCDQLAG